MRVIVLGAAGQLGREVVRALTARGHAVCAVVRREPAPGIDAAAELRFADARSQTDLRAAVRDGDAIVNAIGSGTLRANDVESRAAASAVAVAQAAGIRRYIAMSAGMVAVDWPLFKYVLRPLIFRNLDAEHRRVEAIVRASGLAWTILRPPRLVNAPPRGYIATPEMPRHSFSCSRADVAAFIADELERNAYVRQAVFVASRRGSV